MSRKILINIMLISVLTSGCKELLFEDDLSETIVEYISPADNLSLEDPTVTFWWNPVEDASTYNLLIVTPGFSEDIIEKPILDTNLYSTKFQYTLYPGTFEWRIIAFNNSSFSKIYDIRKLTIDSTESLYSVVLSSPSDQYATNSASVTFKWLTQPNADSYRFELLKDNTPVINPIIWTSNELIVPDDVTELSEFEEGLYEWRVQAQSSNTSPSNFSSRYLYVDRTSPGVPILDSPNNYDTLDTTPVSLSWSHAVDNGSQLNDSVYVCSDSLFTNIVEEAYVSSGSYVLQLEDNGEYFWKVKTIDDAGNISSLSTLKRFTIEK